MEKRAYLKEILIEKVNDGVREDFDDITILEARMSVYLNGEKAISMMCIPMHQEAHAVGFLMSEGVIASVDDIQDISISQEGLRVDVQANINEQNLKNLYKEKTLVSGCGGGVTGNVDDSVMKIDFLQDDFHIGAATISEEIKRFYKESELYNLTGCVHKAMLYLEDGTSLEAEDIGRHNAIDKAVGQARLQKKDTRHAVLMVSGRLSSEMVIKAVMHKIPVVVSRTAPTYLGVKTAHDHGLTLIGFARGKKMNIYTHGGRIDV